MAQLSCSISAMVEMYDFIDDMSWNIKYDEDKFIFPLEDIRSNITVTFEFNDVDLNELLKNNYAVLNDNYSEDSQDDVAAALAEELALYGWFVNPNDILVSDIDTDSIDSDGYGTFNFGFSPDLYDLEDGEPNEFKGYILPDEHDVIIKLAGKNNDTKMSMKSSSYVNRIGMPGLQKSERQP